MWVTWWFVFKWPRRQVRSLGSGQCVTLDGLDLGIWYGRLVRSLGTEVRSGLWWFVSGNVSWEMGAEFVD